VFSKQRRKPFLKSGFLYFLQEDLRIPKMVSTSFWPKWQGDELLAKTQGNKFYCQEVMKAVIYKSRELE
jgi:hypothetical protein